MSNRPEKAAHLAIDTTPTFPQIEVPKLLKHRIVDMGIFLFLFYLSSCTHSISVISWPDPTKSIAF
jgi:hypothetical protein